jgi:chromosome segregation ATPase
MVMREYEDTISRIVVDKEHAAKAWVKEKETLEAERNQATSDLAGAELAFTDLHQKYERAKVALQGMKKNEQELRGSNEKFQDQLVQANERYKKLKHHAEEQLQK